MRATLPGKKRGLVASLLLSAVLVACGGGDDEQTEPTPGTTVVQTVDPARSHTVGTLAENGWQVQAPAGVFGAEPGVLKVRTPGSDERAALQVPAGAQVLALSKDDKEGVRLSEPVQITVPIPAEFKDAQPWELVYGYHINGEWEYWPLKSVNMEAGTAVIEVQHFSWLWGAAKPDRQTLVRTHAQTVITERMKVEQQRQALRSKIGPSFEKTLADLGIQDRDVMNNLILSAISVMESQYLGDEYALTANQALSPLESISTFALSDQEGRNQKALEVLAKSLNWAIQRGLPRDWTGNVIGSLGSLNKAARALKEGDVKGAEQSIYDVLKGGTTAMMPLVGLVYMVGEAGMDLAHNAVDAFAAAELEKAYQVYAGNREGYGYYEAGSGDIDKLLEQMAGGGRELERRMLARYCEKQAINCDQLGQRARDIVLEKGRASLKAYFEGRKAAESRRAEIEAEELAFADAVAADGLLLSSAFYNGFFKDDTKTYDVENRLQRIYNVRQSLQSIFDGPEALRMDAVDMTIAIRFWLRHVEENDREGFYEWARKQGYMATQLEPETPVEPPPVYIYDGHYKGTSIETAEIDDEWCIHNDGELSTHSIDFFVVNDMVYIFNYNPSYSKPDGKVLGNVMEASIDGGYQKYKGTINGDILSGNWSASCTKGTFRAVKQK